jgi:hypothetical protein
MLEWLRLLASIISTLGIPNILILTGTAVAVLFAVVLALRLLIKSAFNTIADFVKKADVESVGPVKFDTDDDKPTTIEGSK